MPNSPRINFNITNNNIEVTRPSNGVSCILARTLTGPSGLSKDIITSVTKFRQEYGAEIVPDGSPSNIEKALKGGSRLRIIRVVGSKGTKAFVYSTNMATEAERVLAFTITGGSWGNQQNYINLRFISKDIYPTDFIPYDSIKVSEYLSNENNGTISIATYGGDVKLDEMVLTSFTISDGTILFDYQSLINFSNNNKYWDVEFKVSGPAVERGVLADYTTNWSSNLEVLTNWAKDNLDGTSAEKVTIRTLTTNTYTISTDATNLNVNKGTDYGLPTIDDWKNAAENLRDLLDVYEVSVSHIFSHFGYDHDSITGLHAYIANIANETKEFQYFIEVPKYKLNIDESGFDTSKPMSKSDIVDWVNTCRGAVGSSMYVCYFGGGIMYYNETGKLVGSDVMGTIHGLADSCASNYGPYRSFAGLNRGVIPDGQGPVSPNYGSPSRYDELNELANACVNMIVLKQTRTSGLATVLWHSFTSQVRQDSFRFIHAVRLALYIKKQIRPILESYIEEPNLWTSWNRIYLEGKPIMDGLVTDNAISEYTWDGDQDATSWDELTVNNEADARNGKYKLNIKVKDVATMQDITVNLIFDQASNTVTANITTNV